MSAKSHDWWVYSTAVCDGVLMLGCKITGAFGIVRDAARKEWTEAFHAPSNPYRWQGGDERVEVIPYHLLGGDERVEG